MDVKEKDIVTAYEHYALAEKLYKTLTEGVDEEVSDDEARVIHVQQIFVTDEESARTVQDLLKERNSPLWHRTTTVPVRLTGPWQEGNIQKQWKILRSILIMMNALI